MKAADIQVGDLLLLKKDNPYGIEAAALRVDEIRTKDGYLTPWIIVDGWGAFRPKDFARKIRHDS